MLKSNGSKHSMFENQQKFENFFPVSFRISAILFISHVTVFNLKKFFKK